MVNTTIRCLRGAAVFGIASIPAGMGLVGPIWFARAPLGGAEFVIGFMLSGGIAGALWAASTSLAATASKASVAFGAGFIIPGIIIPFSLISLQADLDLLWAAISWGFGLGLGAGVAGLILVLLDRTQRSRLPLMAATAFLIGGMTGGPLAFGLFGLASGPGTGLWAFPIGLFLAYAIGGALLAMICVTPTR